MLQDTSFAIHPSKKMTLENHDYIDIGNLLSFTEQKGGVELQCENGFLSVRFIDEDILRITMNHEGSTIPTNSKAIVLEEKNISYSLTDSEDEIVIKSNKMQIQIKKTPVRFTVLDREGRVLIKESKKGHAYKNTGEVICYKEMEEQDHFYGFGEKTGFLNKRGEKLKMWNSDVYAPHNPETDPLYQSIPFFITFRKESAHGLFLDNTSRTVFDLQSENDHYSFEADCGLLDYYIFLGPTMKDVIEQYTRLTGRAPIPPKWSLGYHQSRYSYETEEEVIDLVNKFKEKNIPLDVVHLDIHYMRGYRVFTFDKDRFPNPGYLVNTLKNEGIHVVPIVDPGVKEDPEYKIYQEGIRNDLFCKYIEGNVYFGDVWPGNSAFPDFTMEKVRNWWGEKHKFYTDLGIEGIWNDMNEPAVFNETKTMDVKVIHGNDGDPKTHRELHNLYGYMMSEATYKGLKKLLNNKRPFLLTRAGYAGVQKYAAVWTGDNRSFWEHLQMSLPMIMNIGLSGIPFAGPDVGGFAHDSNGELLSRWMQVGAFTPFFRNHSAILTKRQEPWAFGEKYEDIIRKYINLRYQWMPQTYSLFRLSHETGLPIVRPLVLEYPNDEKTFNISDQFMYGDNVIIAPIMQPHTTVRAVYLPEGRWVDYWTNEVYEGNQYHLVQAELDVLPIFIKEGSVVFHGSTKPNMKVKDTELTAHIYYGDNTSYEFTLYDDDGETFDYEVNKYFKQTFKINCYNNEVNIQSEVSGDFTPPWKLKFVVHNNNQSKIILDGEMI